MSITGRILFEQLFKQPLHQHKYEAHTQMSDVSHVFGRLHLWQPLICITARHYNILGR